MRLVSFTFVEGTVVFSCVYQGVIYRYKRNSFKWSSPLVSIVDQSDKEWHSFELVCLCRKGLRCGLLIANVIECETLSKQCDQDDENHGSWKPLGTLHGASFEGPTRSRSVAEGVLNKSQMRIARKNDFWRMSLTKSLVLEVHWTAKIHLKRSKTFTWTHKCSIFDVPYKKHLVTRRKLWNHQNTFNFQCFKRKPSFVDPPLGTSLGPHGRLNTAQKRLRKGFWWGLTCELLENPIFEGWY